jgi:DNA-binding winged helix-turn-helix (wHTH) protein
VNDPDRPAHGAGLGLEGGGSHASRRGLRLLQHTHAGHIYESRDEQLDVTVAFFRASMDEHLRCVYVHDQLDDAAAAQGLARAGLDVGGAMRTSALEVADRRLLPSRPDEFRIDGLLAFVADHARVAAEAGYGGVRGVGDMGWTIPSDPAHDRLIQYEALVTGALSDLPAAVICQYDRNRFDDAVLFDVVCTHPWLVISGTLCQNPYSVPLASLAWREREGFDLDVALGNILAREREERWLSVAEADLEAYGADALAVDVSRLAAIYEHMRDFKMALRDRARWRLDRPHSAGAARRELAALDREVEWLQQRASLWRRRELLSSGLFFDPVSATMAYRGRAVGLSRLEVALLRVLLDRAGRPIHASELIKLAWEREVCTEAQLRNYIARLRTKLETLRVPASIVTLRGRGYRLTTEVEPPLEV